jgi:hypothetical protein
MTASHISVKNGLKSLYWCVSLIKSSLFCKSSAMNRRILFLVSLSCFIWDLLWAQRLSLLAMYFQLKLGPILLPRFVLRYPVVNLLFIYREPISKNFNFLLSNPRCTQYSLKRQCIKDIHLCGCYEFIHVFNCMDHLLINTKRPHVYIFYAYLG